MILRFGAQARLATRILRDTYDQFEQDRIPEVAAGATFFVLLALFPAFASIVTLYGLFADRATIAHELSFVARFLPRGAVVVLNAELQRLMAQPIPRLGATFLFSTIIALWSASGGLKALVHGLNVAYEVDETRGFIRLSAIAFLFTGAAIVFSLLAVTLGGFFPLVLRQMPFHSLLRAWLPVISWPVAFGLSLMMLAAIYTYGPNRRRPWRWVTWGSVLTAALWLLGTLIFKWYVQNFGNFDRVYGNLGAIIGFLTWIWLSLVVLLFGAELNRRLDRHDQAATKQFP
jgi:membrane protein